MLIDPQIAVSFIENFKHYGNPEADFWFVGPEEAGVRSLEDFARRLEAWSLLNRSSVVDIEAYHRHLGHDQFFRGPKPRTQSTWRRLIMLLLAAKGQAATLEEVRLYQRDRWGRADSETRLTELYPLPAEKRSSWVYEPLAALPGLQFLATRSEYEARCRPRRIEMLRSELAHANKKPKAVVFYGTQQIGDWTNVAGVPIDRLMRSGARFGEGHNTTFVVTMHPAFRDRTGSNCNEFWRETGRELGELCDKTRG